jgi:hypothetical protein
MQQVPQSSGSIIVEVGGSTALGRMSSGIGAMAFNNVNGYSCSVKPNKYSILSNESNVHNFAEDSNDHHEKHKKQESGIVSSIN